MAEIAKKMNILPRGRSRAAGQRPGPPPPAPLRHRGDRPGPGRARPLRRARGRAPGRRARPLVEVLQEALARDHAKVTGMTRAEAKRKTKAFIQVIHKFRDEALASGQPPIEKV